MQKVGASLRKAALKRGLVVPRFLVSDFVLQNARDKVGVFIKSTVRWTNIQR